MCYPRPKSDDYVLFECTKCEFSKKVSPLEAKFVGIFLRTCPKCKAKLNEIECKFVDMNYNNIMSGGPHWHLQKTIKR